MEEDVTFTCPHCWQAATMRLDLSAGAQSYIQDCERCCNPLEVSFTVQQGRVAFFEANSIEQ